MKGLIAVVLVLGLGCAADMATHEGSDPDLETVAVSCPDCPLFAEIQPAYDVWLLKSEEWDLDADCAQQVPLSRVEYMPRLEFEIRFGATNTVGWAFHDQHGQAFVFVADNAEISPAHRMKQITHEALHVYLNCTREDGNRSHTHATWDHVDDEVQTIKHFGDLAEGHGSPLTSWKALRGDAQDR